MKNKIKLISISTILFSVCLVGLQAFQNKESKLDLFEKFKKQSPSGGRDASKKALTEAEDNSANSANRIRSPSLLQNKLDSLQQKKNNNSETERFVAQQDPFTGDTNDYIPEIPLESQTDVPDSTKKQFQNISETMREQGYIEVDDYSVLKISREAISIQHLGSKSLEDVYDSLVFEPTSVKESDFEQGEYLGHKTELGLLEGKGFHSSSEGVDVYDELSKAQSGKKEIEPLGEFSRYYKFSELGVVKLTERFLPEDSETRVTPELMNTDVNGNYAYYLVQKGSTEQSLNMLTWINGDRQYILEALNTGNLVDDTFKQVFFNLANSIP
ncbi:hypothetical protein [Methyloprofundus sp.]|uniref:hypothetical protein n=1 Tax=Methyloprofundus sp. TaxID=2020875 RepID=UPI003D11B588